MDSKKTNYS